jgi:hypothetical protein
MVIALKNDNINSPLITVCVENIFLIIQIIEADSI